MKVQGENNEISKLSPKIAAISLHFLTAIFITLVLIIFAGFREIGFDPDSPTYASIIQNIEFSNYIYFNFANMEPSFYFITYISHWLFNDVVRGTLLIYAILGVTLKIAGIYRLSHIPVLSIVFYLCYYYPLHELTQIRVGVASAIFLIAIPDIASHNCRAYFIKTLLAILFHYQAVIMIPLYLILNAKLGKWFYFIIPIIGLFFYLINQSILNFILANIAVLNLFPSFLSYKIIFHIDLLQKGLFDYINVFNLYYLSTLGLYYFCLININRFKFNVDTTLIQILGVSLFAFPFFSFLPVFAFRIFEFLSIVIMILLASIAFIFKQKYIIIIFALIYSLIALYKTLFATALFSL